MSGHNKSSEENMMDAYYKIIGEAHIDNIIEELEKDKNDIDKMIVPKGNSIVIQYSNDEQTIIFNQSKGEANYQIDTEDADIREIPMGEGSGQLVLKDNRIMLFWSANEESSLIQGETSEQEIIKMADNIKENK